MEANESFVRAWWDDESTWPDVPVLWVSAYCARWRSQSLSVLRTEQRGAGHVIVAARRSPVDIIVHGVVSLFHAGPTVGDALSAKRPDCPASTLPAPEWLTLDCAPRSALIDVRADVVADSEWILRALDLMRQVATAPDTAAELVLKWGLSPHEQLASAKMRYLVKLCVASMPDRLEMHREAYRLGVHALGAWTRAYVRALCPTQKRAVELVRRHSLPFWSCDLLPRPSPCTCAEVPAPTFLSTSAQTVDRLYRGVAACPRSLTHRDKKARIDAEAFYRPDIPVALFVRATTTTAPSHLDQLLARFLYETSHWPGNDTEVCVVEEAGLWGVQDVVFASGGELKAFVTAWSRRFGLSFDVDIYDHPVDSLNTTHFRPHNPLHLMEYVEATHTLGALLPSLYTNANLPAPLECGSVHLFLADGTTHDEWPKREGAWCVYSGDEVGEWIRAQVERDVSALHADGVESLRLDSLTRAINPALGVKLTNLLQAVAAQRNVKLARLRDATADQVFSSKEYHHIEDYASANPQRLVDLFRTLAGADRLTVTPTWVRTAAFVLNIDGERKLRWKDFSLLRGGGHGKGLGSMVAYYLEEKNAAVVLEWLQRWMDEYTRTGSSDRIDPGPAVPASRHHTTPEEELRGAQERIANLLKQAGSASEGTRANSYLRVARGLADAPEHVIERNAHIRSLSRARYTFGDDRPAIWLPAVVFVTEGSYGAQIVYLEKRAGGGKARDVENAKKTQGKVSIAVDRCDAVPICTPPHAGPYPRVFLAEGPETALSVATAFPDAPVYAALGVHNMERFHYAHADTVVLCLEHATDNTREAMRNLRARTRKRLSARFKTVSEVLPPAMVGDKTISDFNDVHQALPGAPGTALIRKTIEQELGLVARDPVVVVVEDGEE